MTIVDMKTLTDVQRTQAAQMLTDELPQGWATLADALQELKELREKDLDATLMAAVMDEVVIGWCGIMPQYNGHVYELHPLVVRHDWQRKGVGTKLMHEAMGIARDKGALTMWLGADDEDGETSLANVDLYDDLPRHIREFDPGTHQSAFYMKLGFKVVGVVPDANGIGKPDIYMAKRL